MPKRSPPRIFKTPREWIAEFTDCGIDSEEPQRIVLQEDKEPLLFSWWNVPTSGVFERLREAESREG